MHGPSVNITRRTPGPNELLNRIPTETRKRNYWYSLPAFFIDYFGYFLGLAGACVVPTWWGKTLCCVLAAFSIGGLFIIGHDAGHYSFVPSRRMNRLLGRLAFLAAYVPLTAWRYNHNVLHHRFLRVKDHDMVWQPWTYDEYRNKSLWSRIYYRILRSPLGFSPYWMIHTWVPRHLLAKREALRSEWSTFQFDRFCLVAFAAAVFAAMTGVTHAAAATSWSWFEPVGPPGIVFWALVLPYLMWSMLMGFVDFIQHTHPRAVWFATTDEWDYATANLRSSTHIILPLGLNAVWHHILEHTAHHVDPRVPLYRLQQAQDVLEEAYPDDVLVERLTLSYLVRLFRTCQLYDFEKQQWLGYDGRPTAPAQRPVLAARRPSTLLVGPHASPLPTGVLS